MNKRSRERSRLVIHAGSAAEAPMPWVRVNARGEPDGQRGESLPQDLAALAARFPADDFCLLVPMADVAIHCVRLPGKHDAAGMRTLPWLLEEKLAAAPETMTFTALASEGENVWAAAVAGGRLTQWTAPFSAAGIRLHQITPDALLLPLKADGVSALQWGDRWLLRSGRWQGTQAEPGWLALWYAAWQRERPESAGVDCYGTPPPALPQWRALPAEEALTLLARGVAQQTASLLAPSRAPRQFTWHKPLAAALAALCLLLAQQGVVWRQTARQADTLEQQLQRRLPGKTAAGLRSALRRGESAELTAWLAKLPALPQGVTIGQLQYRATPPQLQLSLRGDAAQISRVRQDLAGVFDVQPAQDGGLTLTWREARP